MFKHIVFHCVTSTDYDRLTENLTKYEEEIRDFLQTISIEKHTFVNMYETAYKADTEGGRLKTTIVYMENPTRKVLVEKND